MHREPSVKTLFPTFRRILRALLVEWRNPTLRFARLPERRNENVKHFVSPSDNMKNFILINLCKKETHNRRVLGRIPVPLRH